MSLSWLIGPSELAFYRRPNEGFPKGWIPGKLHEPKIEGDLRYATSADAVLPLLEKCGWWSTTYNDGVHIPTDERNWVTVGCGTGREFEGYAATFPLAACLALLKAHGVEVLT